MEARLFQPEDLLQLRPQNSQLLDIPEDKRLEYGWQLTEGSAFTIWDETPEGVRPIFCGGAHRRHAHYAMLWGLFSIYRPKVPAHLTRSTRKFVSRLRERRVEAQASADNAAACGWVRLIGLTEEARLRGAMPDGTDMVIFVKKGMD
ncbi:hypothetical protein [Novosphingobium sp. ST904]|uniref:hypothetical protein n=1 Tax=Novosphingobium sp. ST904 TaxID=1684385 RepID=UPI0006C885D2|nr:hypothetical protein [Novosphingobium sp. ST904]KPH59186.1 hypothetical protein ADT71_23890 [Novosphingobium sp. ST904]TCM37724.1 hypothetical protein EDF59_110120 [Novosphingobium sp. ST904]